MYISLVFLGAEIVILETVLLAGLYMECGTGVHPETLHAIVKTESTGNPYVIANVTDNESYYLTSEEEAISKAKELESSGKKYSAGLMQIYSGNFSAYNLTSDNVFNFCKNISTGADILSKCFIKSKEENEETDMDSHLEKALSCYYSGNFKRGFIKDENINSSYIDRIKLNYSSIFQVPAFSNSAYRKYEFTGSDGENLFTLNRSNPSNINKKQNIDDFNNNPTTKNSWDIFKDFENEK